MTPLLPRCHDDDSFSPVPTPADSNLIAAIHSALGSTYAIERELGGGGMSRVFLAEETELVARS